MSFRSIVACALLSVAGLALSATDPRAGFALWEAGRHDAAVEAFERVLESPADDAVRENTLSALSAILMNRGDHAAALPHVEELLALVERAGRNGAIVEYAREKRATCLMKLGRYDEALADFAHVRGDRAESAQRRIDAITLVKPVLDSSTPEANASLHAALAAGIHDETLHVAQNLVAAERAKSEADRRAHLCTAEVDLDLAMHGDFGNERLHGQLVGACVAKPD